MKKVSTKYLLLLILILNFFGCNKKAEQINSFSSTTDTLIIKTERVKGVGLFPPGASAIQFVDTSEFNYFNVIYPDSISDIKIGYKVVDFKQWIFHQYKIGESGISYIKKYIENNKIDTLNTPSFKDNTICILSGTKGNKKILIVDQNNNKNFNDDEIQEFHKLDWFSNKDLIKCTYKIYDGEKLIDDSTWINIGFLYDDNLDYIDFFVSQHMIGDIKVDTINYKIGIVGDLTDFCFDNPLFALLSEGQLVKDTIVENDLLRIGEYLKLGQNYYCIHDVSNNGKTLTLVKENDFFNKVGTQVGMIAPDFKFVSFEGDTINSSDFKSQNLLIINISGCTRDSYDNYKDLLKEINGKIKVIGMEYTLKENLGGTMLDVENVFNKKIFEDYRNSQYSSYQCFLINQENRVVDKFNILHWKEHLSKYIN